MVWYRVGAADETGGQSGIAHFLEHLMFKGTQKHPGDEFRQRVAAIGGDESARRSLTDPPAALRQSASGQPIKGSFGVQERVDEADPKVFQRQMRGQ
jgi:hypothetical protein